MDDDAISRRSEIAAEFDRIEESAKWCAQGQFEMSKKWGAVNLSVGMPASVLAAVAGATALASTAGRVMAGVIALLSAGFGAVLTTLNAGQRANRSAAAANGYMAIQVAARQARLVDLPHVEIDEARETLSDLTTRLNEQNHAAPPINRRAYAKAKANIEGGGQTHAVDEPSTDGQEG